MIREGDIVTVDCADSHYHGYMGRVVSRDKSGHWLVQFPNGGATHRLAEELKLDPVTGLARLAE